MQNTLICRYSHCLRGINHAFDILGKNFSLEPVLNGQLQDVIGACIAADQSRQLEELAKEIAS